MQSQDESEIIDTVVISEKGQVAIPADIRRKLAIEKGDKLVIVLKNGKMLMVPARNMWKEKMEGEFDYLLKLSEGSFRKLWDNETDDRVWNNI